MFYWLLVIIKNEELPYWSQIYITDVFCSFTVLHLFLPIKFARNDSQWAKTHSTNQSFLNLNFTSKKKILRVTKINYETHYPIIRSLILKQKLRRNTKLINTLRRYPSRDNSQSGDYSRVIYGYSPFVT